MALLLEHLKQQGFKVPPGVTVIKTDNVAEYYFSSPKADWTGKDFINVAPPFRTMWFEFTRPEKANVEGHIERINEVRFRVGFLVQSYDEGGGLEEILAFVKRQGFEFVAEPKWVCTGTGIGVYPDGRGGEIMTMTWGVNADGSFCYFKGHENIPHPFILHLSKETEKVINRTFPDDDTPPGVKANSLAAVVSDVPFLAMTFMHCKNVQVVQSPPHPEALQKARARKGKPPLMRYYTIKVEQIKKVLSAANKGSAHLTPAALHIARGHFKDFRRHGLFGKHHGMFWWDQQLRGSKEAGVVVKDYDVEGPKED